MYGGSLVSPTMGDWDGDGTVDVLAGNSEGRVQFFRNVAPKGEGGGLALLAGVPVEAGGRPIHVQLFWTMQGPEEVR